MAARYVNPENVAAQGQSFYTGLHPVQYESGGAGGKNVMGAGSGGNAGIAADRSGADAGRAWNYPALQMQFGGGDRDRDRDRDPRPQPPAGKEGTPEATPEAPEPGDGMPKAGPDFDPWNRSGGHGFNSPDLMRGYIGERASGFIAGGQAERDRAAGDRSKAAQKGVATKDAKRAEHEKSGPSKTYDVTVPGYRPGFDKVKTTAGEVGGPMPTPGAMTVQPRAPKPQPAKKSPVEEGTHGMWAETIRNRSSSRAMSRARA
jgi:hypothetical protein